MALKSDLGFVGHHPAWGRSLTATCAGMVALKLLILNRKPSVYAKIVIMLICSTSYSNFRRDTRILPERRACVGVGRPICYKSLRTLQYILLDPNFSSYRARYPNNLCQGISSHLPFSFSTTFPFVPGYRPGGPLFFYTGNEGTTVLDGTWMAWGFTKHGGWEPTNTTWGVNRQQWTMWT